MRVAVIGAGVFGSWTAVWLRRRGADVVLLDQYGAGNSLASSGDESRVTRSAHGPDAHYPRWQRHSLEQYRALERVTGERLFVETGVLWFAHRDDGFEADSLSVLAEAGVPVERLDRPELERRFPQIAADGVTWALYEPEGGVLMARRGVAVAAQRAALAGVDVRRAVIFPPGEGDGQTAAVPRVGLADGGSVEADAFVFACGPWLARLFPDLVGPMLEVPRQEVIYFATPPGDDRFDAGSMPTWVDYDASFYGIPSIERRGLKCAPDWPGPLVDPDRQERALSEERIEAARAYLRRRFPAMGGQPVSEGRVCQYELTPDTHFIVDRHPAWENAWIVGGGSGHGYKHGPAMGEYVSALVTGDSAATGLAPPDDRFALRPRRRGIGMRTAAAAPQGTI
ncbi:MAG TPA: FAD-dependent oxidoreductase [Candidatus Limnocylindria bacterium]|nr:FAD-dependent oxidoreductase [Candidatus Limnocylindria bacterium]